MGSELVSTVPLLDDEARGKANAQSLTPFSYQKIFYEALPYYLAIGMTVEQFYDGDPHLAVVYRQAYEYKKKEQNQALWLQGLYIYEAICDCSPILHAFAKQGTKPIPYTKEPYPLDEKELQEQKEREEEERAERIKNAMDTFMASINAKKKKGG